MIKINELTKPFLCAFIFSVFTSASFASTSGYISIDQRLFENDGVESSNDRGAAISTNVRSSYTWKDLTFSGNVLGRVDDQDPTRNIVILQEAMLRFKRGSWELFGGLEKFTLGVHEVFKPSDNLNARNFDSDVENTEKFGELSFGVRKNFSIGDVSLFALPGKQSHYIPGAGSRLGVGVDVQDVQYVESVSGEEYNNEFGAIANFYTELGDFSIFYLNHLDKKLPIFGNRNYLIDPTTTVCGQAICFDGTFNTPYYYETKEYGFMTSIIIFDFVVKLEAVSRNYNTSVNILTYTGGADFDQTKIGEERPENHTDTALGLEYTQYLDSGIELRYLAEYAKVFGVSKAVAAKRFIFQDDLYVGVHVTLNDPMDTKFNLGAIADLSGKNEALYFASFDRRLNPSWRVKSGLRYIDTKSTGSYPQGLEIFEDDHQAYLNFSYYF